MKSPENLKYTKEHTWILVDGNSGTIGITDFAQNEPGEIVFVDLPSIGKFFKKDEVIGSVEAVKTVSDLFIPVTGEIIELKSFAKKYTKVNK